MDPADIEAIERATVAAVAPPEVLAFDGWLAALDDGSISRAKSAGELPLGMAPWACRRSFRPGLARALAVSCCTRLTISAGVPAGASRPNQELAS